MGVLLDFVYDWKPALFYFYREYMYALNEAGWSTKLTIRSNLNFKV